MAKEGEALSGCSLLQLYSTSSLLAPKVPQILVTVIVFPGYWRLLEILCPRRVGMIVEIVYCSMDLGCVVLSQLAYRHETKVTKALVLQPRHSYGYAPEETHGLFEHVIATRDSRARMSVLAQQ